MTRLLASVLDADEAEIALEAGADIVDLKDARHGALGALPLPVVRDALDRVAGRRPVSATLGDLPMQPALVRAHAIALGAVGVDFIKVGLFDAPGRAACIEALAAVARQHRLVGVLFADQRPALDLIPLLARAGFAGVMIDTAHKSGPGLRRLLDEAALRGFVAAARQARSQIIGGASPSNPSPARGGGLGWRRSTRDPAHADDDPRRFFCGLAGSLGIEDIPPLLKLEPDYLGFRGALCSHGRRSERLDVGATARIRDAIPRHPRALA